MWREVRFSAERSAVQTTALFANVYLCVTGGLQPEKHPRACNVIFVRSTNNAHAWMLLSTTSNRHCVRVGVDVRRGARALCDLGAPLEALAILAGSPALWERAPFVTMGRPFKEGTPSL